MSALTLVYSTKFPIDRYREALETEAIRSTPANEATPNGEAMRVVLLDDELADGDAVFSGGERDALLGIGLSSNARWMADDRIYLHLPAEPSSAALLGAIRRAHQFLMERAQRRELEQELRKRTRELEEVNKVGIAMSTIRDHDVLLNMILRKSRELSRADAGSLYLLDDDPEQGRILRWKLAQNDSIEVDFEERVLPITKKSLAGYVALTGETLVIDDAYRVPEGVEYTINRSFDLANGYLTRSIAVFPMTNHEGDTIGVLQLLNRRREGAPAKLTAATVPSEVVPFDEQTLKLVRSLASQAAVALDNNLLYESIERLFEGFVTASVTAIEQRDPTTSGHSFRVADLTVELARLADQLTEGPFASARFSADQVKELRYASLLHDFGKVGVREKVLVKEKKLYPLELDLVRARFEYMMKNAEAEHHRAKLDYVMKHGTSRFEEAAMELDARFAAELAQLEQEYQFVVRANEPTVLPEGDFAHLVELAKRQYEDARRTSRPILSEEEVRILSIRRGNLDPTERDEIESHVTHTYRFLSKIPWTRDLRNVPDIAYAHHEKLNGGGYPRKLASADIPLQSKMMTVSDIYDALTANDRPYKKAVPTARALDILKMEMNDGLLDRDVIQLFLDAKVYERAGVVRPS